jgi:surface antigen
MNPYGDNTMIGCKSFFGKNALTSLCAAIVTAVLMTGCITDPVTGQSTLDPKFVAAGGALAGGVAGAVIGNAIGGKDGMAIGAGIGAGVGGLVGYFITDYLNTREQQEYLAKLNQQMKATPANATGSTSWDNADRTKIVNTTFTEEVPVQRVSALGNKIQLNQQRLASLPSDTTCRAAKELFQVKGQQASTLGAYCRDANGDYIKVDGTTV